jgi:hypothetical protein
MTTLLRNYPFIRYVTHINHQPLTRGWNWLILMAKCDRVLILNDDVSFNLEFRHNLENLCPVPDVFTLNGSWSHFVISKNIIRRIGWFDERFLGIGDEDYDYIFRLAMNGITLVNVPIHGLHNFVAPPTQAGWANFSGVVHGKYSEINREFFMKKWWVSDIASVPISGAFHVQYKDKDEEWNVALRESLEEMPEYYPMTCLGNSNNKERRVFSLAGILAKTCSFSNRLYWLFRLIMGSWARRLLGQRWDKWRSKIAR